MKQTLFENPYITIEYGLEDQILYMTGTQQMSDLTQQMYEKLIIDIMEAASQVESIRAVLDNGLESTLLITPEVQAWVVQQYAKVMIPKGVKRYALVVPQEFFANLSFKQTLQEAEKLGIPAHITIRPFHQLNEALQWLNEDQPYLK